MSQVSFVFATGESWLDSLVTTVTKSRWSHVALRFDAEDLLVESLVFRGLILQCGKKYEDWPVSQTISREIPDMHYKAMLVLSRSWGEQNIPYGYATCAAIGLKELLGLRIGKAALKLSPGKEGSTLVCSEMLVKLWRIAFPDFLSAMDSRLVSPDEFYRALLNSGEDSK